ncbi:MAG: branched-chain amino acid ABC transporter permease [Proteobacteria bacterium]|nr:branched-chain amino acid ABC transporter permease [Pseudomonadota bacterium]NIS68910.1 branched-chain amino acid ABC transporter permease [Pseudomonadota bacterium]
MTFAQFVQMFANGTMLGFQLSLFATGLTLVYGIMHIINFAHGELYMIGAFAVWFFFEELGINYLASLALAMAFVASLAITLERIFFKPMRGYHIPSFIMSTGLIFVLQVSIISFFGVKDKGVESVFPGLVKIAGVTLSVERLMIIPISLVVIVVFYVFLRWSRYGRAMRAVMQDPDGAALQGVSIDTVCSLAMGIGGAMAAAAGGLLAPIFVVNPFLGPPLAWEGFIVVCLGGRTSLPGTILAAFIMGYIKSFVSTLVDPIAALMCAAAILGVILIVRPQGLLGYEA